MTRARTNLRMSQSRMSQLVPEREFESGGESFDLSRGREHLPGIPGRLLRQSRTQGGIAFEITERGYETPLVNRAAADRFRRGADRPVRARDPRARAQRTASRGQRRGRW